MIIHTPPSYQALFEIIYNSEYGEVSKIIPYKNALIYFLLPLF